MNIRSPTIGIILTLAFAAATVGAGYYTWSLSPKGACSGVPETYTVNVTAHQWFFIINGTDATANGWKVCHGWTIKFVLSGVWEHNSELGHNYTRHGFYIIGLMSAPVFIDAGQISSATVTFANPGTYTLQCTEFCGELAGVGSHSTMKATITVV